MTPERQAIVDALAGVDGINPSPYPPAPIVAGSAWPGWSQTRYPQGPCYPARSYYVFAALPNGATGASVDAGDELSDVIAEALFPIAKVSVSEPWSWPVEPGQQAIPLLRFTIEV